MKKSNKTILSFNPIGLAAWLPKGERVSYCPVHNEIVFGFFKAHYCDNCIDLGNTEDSYVDFLEKEIEELKLYIPTIEYLKIR